MSDAEIRSSHLLRRRPVHATSGVLDEIRQELAVVEAEQAEPVTNGYAWSGRMRATGDVVETMIPRRLLAALAGFQCLDVGDEGPQL
jgi:hypothetical protein